MPGGYCPLPLQLRPTEDGIPAGGWNRAADDLAFCARVQPFAVVTVGLSSGHRVVLSCLSRAGVGTTFGPTRVSDTEFAFPSTWTDELGIERPFRIRAVKLTAGTADPYALRDELVWKTDGVTVQFDVWNLRTGAWDVGATITIQVWIDDATSWNVYGGSLDRRDSEQLPPAAAYYEVIKDSLGTAYNCAPGTIVDAEVCAEARAVACVHREAERVPLDAIPATATGNLADWAALLQVTTVGRTDDMVRAKVAERYRAMGRKVIDFAVVEAATRAAMGRFFISLDVNTGGGLLDEPSYTAVGSGFSSYILDQFDLGGGCWTSGRAHLVVRCTPPAASEVEEFQRLAHVELTRAFRRLLPATVSWSVAAGAWALDFSRLDIDTTLA